MELTPALAAMAMPSRRVPGTPRHIDVGASWEHFKKHAVRWPFNADLSDTAQRAAIIEAGARFANCESHGSQASDVFLLAVEASISERIASGSSTPYTDLLVAERGLVHAVEVLLLKETSFVEQRDKLTFGATDLALREHLARAPLAVWEQCLQGMREAMPALPPWRRPLLVLLMPDATALADQAALLLQAPEGAIPDAWCAQNMWLCAYARSEAAVKALQQWPRAQRSGGYELYGRPVMAAPLVQDLGIRAEAILSEGADDSTCKQALACIGTPQAIAALAGARRVYEQEFAFFYEAMQRWPDASLPVLSELIAKDRCGPPGARRALAGVLARHADRVPALAPWMPAAAWKVLSTMAARYIGVHDVAAAADLPEALARPRWAAPTGRAMVRMELDPLPLAPVAQWSAQQREQLGKRQHYATYLYGFEREAATKELAAALAADDAGRIVTAWIDCMRTGTHQHEAARMIGDLPAPLNARVWNAVAANEMHHPGYILARIGLDGLPGLLAMVERRPAQNLWYALYYGAVELAPLVARAYATMRAKALLASARQWLLAYPEHAACGLAAAALGQPGEAREHARRALRMLAAAGHAGLLMEVAARYGQSAVAQAMRALIDEDPLELYPAKIGKLPAFWQPREWTRPILAGNGKALPDEALDTIGTMLGFPFVDGMYAGLAQVRAACTSDSLADFAWDLFRAWVEDGAPPKSNWAYFALGLLGNDDSARSLTPLIRAWPGESQHARAAAGLDILAMIGSDLALMLLNGIAQKLKFKGLQDRAREKIAAIAEERGLSAEELEDYLAPDLGLDQRGEMALDFGPRRFVVGFDETLKPFVRDQAGARLADLPKPKKTDDAGLSAEAVARFKLLKKDARTVAAQQVLRLEMAMCTQRRWQAALFREMLLEHPLLRHLVQRLVWGAYGDGDALLACFRVACDGSLTDAGDDAFVLPRDGAVNIGIVHALEMAPDDAAGFGRLFADYELLQPFAQIGRDTYPMQDDERDSDSLGRWGDPVPTWRVLGLADRGWQRAPAEDGGTIRAFTKRLGAGHMATLQFSPGLMAGNIDEFPQQTPGCLLVGRLDEWGGMGERITLASLGAVVVSELIRDMQQLGA